MKITKIPAAFLQALQAGTRNPESVRFHPPWTLKVACGVNVNPAGLTGPAGCGAGVTLEEGDYFYRLASKPGTTPTTYWWYCPFCNTANPLAPSMVPSHLIPLTLQAYLLRRKRLIEEELLQDPDFAKGISYDTTAAEFIASLSDEF